MRRGDAPARFTMLDPPGSPVSAVEFVTRTLAERPDHADRPAVYVNMIGTLDGRATVHGRTEEMGGEGDLELLMELRTVADAILVGTGTIRAEGYGRFMSSKSRRARRVAAGKAGDPPAILIARRFDVPWDAGLFASPEQPVIVYTERPGEAPSGVAAPVEVVQLEQCTPAAVLADLERRGIEVLLCEGGPTLFRAFLDAGVVDELFLTLFPWVTADTTQPAILSGPALAAPFAPSLLAVLRFGDELFLRYAVSGPPRPTVR